MKKYLPSLPELVTGIVIVVAGLLAWNFIGTPIMSWIDKAKSKVTS